MLNASDKVERGDEMRTFPPRNQRPTDHAHRGEIVADRKCGVLHLIEADALASVEIDNHPIRFIEPIHHADPAMNLERVELRRRRKARAPSSAK